jgi:hypothetical protein
VTEGVVGEDLTDDEVPLILRPLHVEHVWARTRRSPLLHSTGHTHLLVALLLIWILPKTHSAVTARSGDMSALNARACHAANTPLYMW